MALLDGKKVLVTGGYRGNGKGIVQGLIREGANVAVFDKHIGDIPEVSYYHIDLLDTSNLDNVFKKACTDFNGFDALVNNAGISISHPSEEYPVSDWDQTLKINLTVPFLLSQLFAKNAISQNTAGSIINITSLGATLGFPDNPAYCASKGGLRMLTKAMAFDFADYGIRVNSVAPGYMRTDMTKKSWENEQLRQERSNHIMMDRWGTPEDLAGVCVFLISDMSNYITGQEIHVDGGWTAKGL